MKKGICISSIRNVYEGEFENDYFGKFCEEIGIYHNFSTPRTPQKNGVVERKTRSLQKMERTMLNNNIAPKYL